MRENGDAMSRTIPEGAIAIVGMACRYPGEGSCPSSFWDMVSHGRTAHSTTPASRYNAAAWYHPDPERRGSIITKSGYFIDEDPSVFDAPFFSISTDEANTMDPMHRWMLETAYEGFENAGISMTAVSGSPTGCFMGCFTQDYTSLSNEDIFRTGSYSATGTGLTMLSNRVSWFFDLKGPSLTIDTACSSSMHALHLACQSIKAGEIRQAIVGGANLLLYPDMYHSLSRMRMMSPDGKCHTFDERANGYGRGEGIGVLVVKSLSAALADGDTIRAIIRATGCNQDGRTPGITVPSARAQADLILSTYASAGLSLDDTAYFEAHGTGTPVGDPLELSAIGATFGAARSPDDPPIFVSSVKSNIGHTEGCSALAGILKAVMCIEKGLIVPVAGLKNLNPRFRLAEWKIEIPRETIPWPTTDVRRVSVNSFGYGGANGHVILDDAVSYLAGYGLEGNTMTVQTNSSLTHTDSGIHDSASEGDEVPAHPVNPARVFVYSAFDQAGIARIASSWTEYLSKNLNVDGPTSQISSRDSSLSLADLAFTLAMHRTTFNSRSFAVARSHEEIHKTLSEGLPNAFRAIKNGNIILVFTGQGAQWAQMGVGLLPYPAFSRSLEATQAILDQLNCPWNLLRELKRSNHSNINDPEFSQPICTAIQIALVDLLLYWGLKAKAVVGHSSGEIGAAYAAQIISHRDAMKVAYYRGIYSREAGSRMQGIAGGMLAAGLTEQEAQEYVNRPSSGKVVVACVNSPSSVTISGDSPAIEELNLMLNAEGKFARPLKVSAAYHSHHMMTIAEDYLHSISDLEPSGQPDDAPLMFSSVTGERITPTEINASYWVRNMINPVKFSQALHAILSYSPKKRGRRTTKLNHITIIEVGPHPALKGPINEILSTESRDMAVVYTHLLCRGQADDITALNCAGRLWSVGHDIDLKRVNLQDDRIPRKVLAGLPPYPWNHSKSFWHESELAKAKRLKMKPRNDLLGMAVDVQNSLQPQWRQLLSVREQPWLEHHKITNTTLLPGAAMLIMALEAAYETADENRKVKAVRFRNVNFDRGLVLSSSPERATEVSLTFHPHKIKDESILGSWYFTIFSLPPGGKWSEHCSGQLTIIYEDANANESNFPIEQEWKSQTDKYQEICTTSDTLINKATFYNNVDTVGIGYGELFQNLGKIVAGPACGHGIITVPDTKSSMPYKYEYPHHIHPATLDAIFHLVFVCLYSGRPPVAAVPISIENITIYADLPAGAGSRFRGYSCGRKTNIREGVASIVVSDDAWSSPKIVINNLSVRNVNDTRQTILASEPQQSKLVTHIRWIEDVVFLRGPYGEASLQQISEDSIEQLVYWLQCLCHKQANLSVLIWCSSGINGDNTTEVIDSTVMTVLRHFAPRPGLRECFDRCTIATDTQFRQNEMKEKFERHAITNVDFRTADISQDLAEQSFDSASFDLVIVCGYMDCTTRRHTDATMSKLAALLRGNGWLISHFGLDFPVSTTRTPDSAQTNFNLESYLTLSSPAPCAQDNIVTIDRILTDGMTGAERAGNSQSLPVKEIIILMPTSPSLTLSKFRDHVASRLEAHAILARSMTMSEAVMHQKTTIISLLEIETPFIISMDQEEFEMLKKICTLNRYMLWVSRSAPDFSPATGFFRVLRTELQQNTMPHIQISDTFGVDLTHSADLLLEIFHRTMVSSGDQNTDMEFAEKDGRIYIPRLVAEPGLDAELCASSDDPPPMLLPLRGSERPLRLTPASPGDTNSLVWVDDTRCATALAETEIEIKVTGVPLHIADLENVMGNTATPMIGLENFGIVTRVGLKVSKFNVGQTVAAIGQNTCCTLFRQHQDFVVSLGDASAGSEIACSPLTILTAFHLVDLARLHHRERIFILSAATAISQVAVQLARHAGAEIFLGVSSSDERATLSRLYSTPQDHIFDLHHADLAQQLHLATNGQDFDVILSDATGVVAQQAWHGLADFGRFLDYAPEASLVSVDTKRQVTYQRVDMQQLIAKRRHIAVKALAEAYELVGEGIIGQTEAMQEFPASQASEAIEWLQQKSNKGLAVLKLDEGAQVNSLPAKPSLPRLDPSASYLVVGGLGGLGPGIVNTLIECGARHVLIISRSGMKTEKHRSYVQSWHEAGCIVDAVKCDCADAEQLRIILSKSQREGREIKGMIQAAAVLKDSPFETMSFEQWQGSIRPKIQATKNLHDMLPDDLDFFITLSSISNIIGNAAQSNYCAGNSFQDALCEYRRSRGLKGVSISLGGMTDTNDSQIKEFWTDFLIKNPHIAPLQFKEGEFWCVLKACIKGTAYQDTPVDHNIITGVDNHLERASKISSGTAAWATDRKFELRLRPLRETDDTASGSSSHGREVGPGEQLEAATTGSEAAMIVESAIRSRLAYSMSVDPEQIESDRPLQSYSVDSLKAVEMRNWVLQELKAEISIFDILGPISISRMAIKIVIESKSVKAEIIQQAKQLDIE